MSQNPGASSVGDALDRTRAQGTSRFHLITTTDIGGSHGNPASRHAQHLAGTWNFTDRSLAVDLRSDGSRFEVVASKTVAYFRDVGLGGGTSGPWTRARRDDELVEWFAWSDPFLLLDQVEYRASEFRHRAPPDSSKHSTTDVWTADWSPELYGSSDRHEIWTNADGLLVRARGSNSISYAPGMFTTSTLDLFDFRISWKLQRPSIAAS